MFATPVDYLRMFMLFLASPQGSPEISWISHDTGCVSGGNEIGLIGSKFNKGFKVRFYCKSYLLGGVGAL